MKKQFVPVIRIKMVRDRRVEYHQTLSNSMEAADLVRRLIDTQGNSDRENFVVVYLDVKNQIAGTHIAHVGSVSRCTVSTREIFKCALLCNASALILAHNHPSGDCVPSREDFELTGRVLAAARLMDMQVHEHVIVDMNSTNQYSMCDTGDIYKL